MNTILFLRTVDFEKKVNKNEYIMNYTKPIPNLTMDQHGQLNFAFIDEPFVKVISSEKIQVQMMYPVLGMKHAVSDCFMRKTVYDKLVLASKLLPEGYGFCIWDAWRPFLLQKELYDTYASMIIHQFKKESLSPEAQHAFLLKFIGDPIMDPYDSPAHTTGGAVDLTLTKDGIVLKLGTEFDAFTDKTNTNYFEKEDHEVKGLRRLLYNVMIEAGFTNLPSEWWHYDYGDNNYAKMSGKDVLYTGVFEAKGMKIHE